MLRATCRLAAICRADRPTSNRSRTYSRILRMDKRSILDLVALKRRSILVDVVLRRPQPGGGRMAVESVAGSPWNRRPDQRGMGGRMAVESVAECAWITHALQLWATWILYAVLVDLTDAVAEALARPFDDLSMEMVYRSLYFVTGAMERDPTTDPVRYLAEEARDLGIIKRPRQSSRQQRQAPLVSD